MEIAQQHNNYIVESLGTKQVSILTFEDKVLINSFTLNPIPFLPAKYTVNLSLYDLDENYIETFSNISSYSILGSVQGDGATEITVNPVADITAEGYSGDVIVSYEVFNNLFSPSKVLDDVSTLYITDISTDRTEIRARSTQISESNLKKYADNLYSRFNNQAYFSEAYLYFISSNQYVPCINVITEVLNNTLYVTFKLYESLPTLIEPKSIFSVLERVGEPTRLRITREVKVLPKSGSVLQGPNFNVDAEKVSSKATKYINYGELLNYPVSSSYYELYSQYGKDSAQISVNYEDFTDFIHFSSAAERLENFRYKLGLLIEYQNLAADTTISSSSALELKKYKELISDTISKFDHYEKYLYFESSSTAWPKSNTTRPYVNVDPTASLSGGIISEWWNNIITKAKNYDNLNPDILIGDIPLDIRENPDNEPALLFVDMIGQHFDNEWIYAKAVSDRYKADNRLDFGISKDLVHDAIKGFGINLRETNQNLDNLFESNSIDGHYQTGSETSITTLKRITKGEDIPTGSFQDSGTYYQPMLSDTYQKEVYKRIYHNIPLLLKAKGTERGVRTLINCFGIPSSILEINTVGGTGTTGFAYFGPRTIQSSSLGKIRVQTGSLVPYAISRSGEPITSSVLTLDVPILEKDLKYSDDSPELGVGFKVNKQFDNYAIGQLRYSAFNYDGVVGDPGNTEENYGTAFKSIRENIISQSRAVGKEQHFRSPSALIRLVRYFDTTLFRSLRDFIPARSSLSSGVIVEDNLLHRNRYSGLKTEALNEKDKTGVVKIGSITGSTAGIPTWPSGIINPRTGIVEPGVMISWSTAQGVGSASLTDQSYKYNGELSGSTLTVSDGEVFKKNLYNGIVVSGNPYAKAKALGSNYKLNVRFLSLPKEALCDFTATASFTDWIYSLYSTLPTVYSYQRYEGTTYDDGTATDVGVEAVLDGGNASSVSVDKADGGYATGSKTTIGTDTSYGSAGERTEGYVVIPNSSIAHVAVTISTGSNKYLGWYSGQLSSTDRTNQFTSFLGGSPTLVITSGSEQSATARFSSDSVNSLSFTARNTLTSVGKEIQLSYASGLGTLLTNMNLHLHIATKNSITSAEKTLNTTISSSLLTSTGCTVGVDAFIMPTDTVTGVGVYLLESSSIVLAERSGMKYFYDNGKLWQIAWLT